MKYFLSSTIVTMMLLVFPETIQAQGLVVCDGTAANPCDFCALGVMTNNIINWLFGFMTLVAVLTFAYAGFQLVTSGGDTGARDAAKKRFSYVIIGFLIMLSSWLIVDTVLKGLTGSEKGMEFWGSFDVSECGSTVVPEEREYEEHTVDWSGVPNMIAETAIQNNPTVSSAGVYSPSSNVARDGGFSYQSGIQQQAGHASPELQMLLNCILSQVPGDVGQISSISDSLIVNGSKTWQQCWDGECTHTGGSCHYGNGYGAVGRSYAVDFGDEQNADDLIGAAYACGAGYAGVHNGNHVHISAAACRGN